jgi:hypothetical protein
MEKCHPYSSSADRDRQWAWPASVEGLFRFSWLLGSVRVFVSKTLTSPGPLLSRRTHRLKERMICSQLGPHCYRRRRPVCLQGAAEFVSLWQQDAWPGRSLESMLSVSGSLRALASIHRRTIGDIALAPPVHRWLNPPRGSVGSEGEAGLARNKRNLEDLPPHRRSLMFPCPSLAQD